MIRRLALAVSLSFAAATFALAQTHPQTHTQGRPHGTVGHESIDPAQHAALHALLIGHWTGTSSAGHDVDKKLELTVAKDKDGNMTLMMSADKTLRAGAASHIAIEGTTVKWTQNLSGNACEASAVLTAATKDAPDTMTGTMACGAGESTTFKLQKNTTK